MHDRIQLAGRPRPLLLNPLQLHLVRILEHTVTSNMIAFLLRRHILPYSPEHIFIIDSRSLKQCDEVVGREMAVRAAVRFAAAGGVFGQDLLAREGGVALPAPRSVSTDVAVRVTHVVFVLLVEFVVCFLSEARAPEDEAIFQAQPDAFEEERVL